jgi:hypothetical protein
VRRFRAQADPRIDSARAQAGARQLGADGVHDADRVGPRSIAFGGAAELVLKIALFGGQFAQLVDGLDDLISDLRPPVQHRLIVHSHLILRLSEKALYINVYNDAEVQGFCGFGPQHPLCAQRLSAGDVAKCRGVTVLDRRQQAQGKHGKECRGKQPEFCRLSMVDSLLPKASFNR